jgi:threonine/homoserine/homoserine lactone efflux protein
MVLRCCRSRVLARGGAGVLGCGMRSFPEFLLVALLVTLTPGPGTATIIRVAARDGRGAALSAVVGNSAGVLLWAALSAVGVSSLILASEVAYTVLKIGGAVVLIVLGLRSLLHRPVQRAAQEHQPASHPATGGWRAGLVTSVSNPKLAVFFVALFPQFLSPHAAVLPAALAMAGVIVTLDVLWFSALTYAVDRARAVLRPRVQQMMERITGSVMVGLGVRLAIEPR